jgi:hypothetical protein
MTSSIDDLFAADESEPTGTVLEAACDAYREAGLRFPPVPLELTDDFDEQAGEWHYGTTDASLTDRIAFEADAQNPATPAQVAFGHVGHGVASWWLCYRLIRPSLAVFVRQSYGSAYEDNEEASRDRVNVVTAEIEELIVLADAAQAAGSLPAGQRLIVVVDDVEGSYWQVGSGPQAPEDGSDALFAAVAHLRSS